MILPEVVTREEWLVKRMELLAREKELTRARDTLNADRRRLPMVEVDKDYVFEGSSGRVGLLDLFEGRLQLIVHHFMFDPEWDTACRSCSSSADDIGRLEHLHARTTTLAAVSRAPYAKIEPFRARMGWTFPWYSSYGSDFNYDFHVSLDPAVAPPIANYRKIDVCEPFELPGLSCFLRDGDRVFHTYSTFARGIEAIGGTGAYLDLTALGRQEEWEEPAGRATGLGVKAGSPELRYHDEYGE